MKEKYESLALVQLRELAKVRGLKGTSSMKKADLVEAMLAEDEQRAPRSARQRSRKRRMLQSRRQDSRKRRAPRSARQDSRKRRVPQSGRQRSRAVKTPRNLHARRIS